MKNALLLIALAGLVGTWVPRVTAEPWSEKLGFDPERRVVILDLRELGLTWEANSTAKSLIDQGKVVSGSILATGPWFNDIARHARANPQADYGVSIALTNPYASPEWRLLTTGMGHTTLVDADGMPWRNVVQLALNADVGDVAQEIDAQLRRARLAGIEVTHLAGYYGTILSRADLAEVFLDASRKHWIPAPVVEVTPELIDDFRRRGYPIDDEIIHLVNNYPMPKLDDLKFSPTASTYEEKKKLFIELLGSLTPGLTQIVLQPSVDSAGLRLMAEDADQRVWDAELLADPDVDAAMQKLGVELTNWRELMRRFEMSDGGRAAAAKAESGD